MFVQYPRYNRTQYSSARSVLPRNWPPPNGNIPSVERNCHRPTVVFRAYNHRRSADDRASRSRDNPGSLIETSDSRRQDLSSGAVQSVTRLTINPSGGSYGEKCSHSPSRPHRRLSTVGACVAFACVTLPRADRMCYREVCVSNEHLAVRRPVDTGRGRPGRAPPT
jgi:hypothetical protein